MNTTATEPDGVASHRSTTHENIQQSTQLELSQRLSALTNLTSPQLRDEWRRLYRGQPPRLSRDLLVRSIAYRMQELTYGALSKAMQRKLLTLAKELETNGGVVAEPGPRLRPGVRLVREWHGRTHTVVVTEDGFEYARKAYSSLSRIAHVITGAHWSGPRFFGLTRSEASTARTAQCERNASDMIGEGEESDG